jgi:hypothetical protein
MGALLQKILQSGFYILRDEVHKLKIFFYYNRIYSCSDALFNEILMKLIIMGDDLNAIS